MATIMIVATAGNFFAEQTQITLIERGHIAQIIKDRNDALECLRSGCYDFLVSDNATFLNKAKAFGGFGNSIGVHSKLTVQKSRTSLPNDVEALLKLCNKRELRA